jgi:uncharacterized protein involved in outer membrane biogenesis
MKLKKTLVSIVAVIVLLIVAALLTDWRFLRHPVERIASDKLGRQVTLADFRMHLRPVTRIHLGGLQVANVPQGQPAQMAGVESADFAIHLLPLLHSAIVFESIALRGGEVHLARDKAGNNNWTLANQKSGGKPPDVTVKSLALDSIDLNYDDRVLDFNTHILASTQTGQPADSGYGLKLDFDGHYHGGPYDGKAFTGGILTLKDSGQPFPFLIDGKGGPTKVHAQGKIGDIFGNASVDVALDISSSTLANLYPFINLPLPDTPAYRIRGHLYREGTNFRLTGINGTIGSTDIAGDASYAQRPQRPMLTARLTSKVLDIKDLGPLIGADKDKKTSVNAPEVKTKEPVDPNRRVLPDTEFHIGRLNAIDADVTLDAASVRFQSPWAFDNFSTHLLLDDGVLKLVPLNFGYAGGQLRSDITLDARQTVIRTDAHIAMQKARLSRLFPNVELMKTSDGTLGADVKLKTTGNSVRTMMARADGSVGIAVAGGEMSTLVMEIVGLDAGQSLEYLVGGDKKTPIRCAVSNFDVKKGLATVDGMVIDTNDTRINGSGSIDLADEKIGIRLEPKPKDKSILSMRAPINIDGTFAKPGFSVDKKVLFARAGAAVALGLINPFAALIPLIETGPGKDANCTELLAEVGTAKANAGPATSGGPNTPPTKKP